MKQSAPTQPKYRKTRQRAASARVTDKPHSVARPFSADELRRISADISRHWPDAPTQTRLTLLDVDPWRIHAYWHVEPAELQQAHAELGNTDDPGALVLRFTDISAVTPDQTPQHFDIQVNHDQDHWYIDLRQDAKRYSAQLGLIGGDGRFVALARSNPIETAPSGPSPERDFRQAEVALPQQSGNLSPARSAVTNPLLGQLYPVRQRFSGEFPRVMSELTGDRIVEPPFPALPPDPDSTQIGMPWRDRVGNLDGDFPLIEAAHLTDCSERSREQARQILAGIRSRLASPPLSSIGPSGPNLTLSALPSGVAGGDPATVALETLLSQPGSSFSLADAPASARAEITIEANAAPGVCLTLFGTPVTTDRNGSIRLSLPLSGGAELLALLQQADRSQGS